MKQCCRPGNTSKEAAMIKYKVYCENVLLGEFISMTMAKMFVGALYIGNYLGNDVRIETSK